MTQNFTTIDKYRSKLVRDEYIRLSEIHDDSEGPHFVISRYKENRGQFTNTLLECWHFIGLTAEVDSSDYFCSLIPELYEEFPAKAPTEYPTYKPEKYYLKSEEEVAPNA